MINQVAVIEVHQITYFLNTIGWKEYLHILEFEFLRLRKQTK